MEEQIFTDCIKTHFYLRGKQSINSFKPLTVYCRVTFHEFRHKCSLGVKCFPQHWNKVTQKAYISCYLCEVENYNNHLVNQKIHEMVKKIEKLKQYIKHNPKDKKTIIAKAKNLSKQVEKSSNDIKVEECLTWFREFIKKESMHNQYSTACSQIENFIECHKGHECTNSFFTHKGMKEFREFLQKEQFIKTGYKKGEKLSVTSIN